MFVPSIQGGLLRSRIAGLLRVEDDAKPVVYAQVFAAAEIASLNYWLELTLAAGIATLGLVLNSPAVIIGAMLVSPLMGPIMATGLALAIGDLYLGIKAAANLVVSIAAAVALSAALVWVLPFHAPTAEILARTNPNLLDLGVALLSGLAGSVVMCRGGGGGGVTALPGVAIAVALMPPLCTIGFGAGSGAGGTIIRGAALLFVTNLAAIVASAFAVFFLVRMDAPKTRQAIDEFIRARASADPFHQLLRSLPFASGVGHIGKLHWRILMLALALGALFFPLRNALMQVRDDTLARGAIQDTLRRLAPADAMLAQQVGLGREHIRINLATTMHLSPEALAGARNELARRTGRNVAISVREVASKEEISELLDRVNAPPPLPPPPPPAPKTLDELRAEILPHLDRPIREVWPEQVPILGYELGLAPDAFHLRIRHGGPRPFTRDAREVMERVLATRLQVSPLTVELEHVRSRR